MSEPLPLSQQNTTRLEIYQTRPAVVVPPFGLLGQVDRLRRDVVEGRLLDPGLRRRLRHDLLLLQDGQALAQAQYGGLRRRLQ